MSLCYNVIFVVFIWRSKSKSGPCMVTLVKLNILRFFASSLFSWCFAMLLVTICYLMLILTFQWTYRFMTFWRKKFLTLYWSRLLRLISLLNCSSSIYWPYGILCYCSWTSLKNFFYSWWVCSKSYCSIILLKNYCKIRITKDEHFHVVAAY